VSLRASWRSLAVALGVLTGACSLLVETSDLSSGSVSHDASVDAPDARDAPDAPDALPDAPPGRVTDGLVAFFSFRGDAGTVVHDTAPGGDNLELLVERAPGPDGDGGVRDAATSGPTIQWLSPGMSVVGRVLIASTGNATSIQSRCDQRNELTVEAWVKPASVAQEGPARIVTMSLTGTPANRNFMLAQERDHYLFRLRNETVDSGVVQRSSDGGVALALTHVVVTARANGEMTFWVNGARTTHALPSGVFAFKPYRLAMANEIDGFASERLWLGDYRLVAIYCRALTEAEISRNRAVGPTP
jgi:Concanavalin A-like lectin/glucanases superfamily